MSTHDRETTEKIRELLSLTTESSVDNIHLESTLRDELAIDSVETLDMVGHLEQAFDVEISDDDVHTLRTVADIVELISTKRARTCFSVT